MFYWQSPRTLRTTLVYHSGESSIFCFIVPRKQILLRHLLTISGRKKLSKRPIPSNHLHIITIIQKLQDRFSRNFRRQMHNILEYVPLKGVICIIVPRKQLLRHVFICPLLHKLFCKSQYYDPANRNYN